jgi:hypothetical protein
VPFPSPPQPTGLDNRSSQGAAFRPASPGQSDSGSVVLLPRLWLGLGQARPGRPITLTVSQSQVSFKPRVRSPQFSSIRLNPTQFDSIRLNSTQLDSIGLNWTQLDSIGLNWTQLDSIGLNWTQLDSIGLTSTQVNANWSCWQSNMAPAMHLAEWAREGLVARPCGLGPWIVAWRCSNRGCSLAG